ECVKQAGTAGLFAKVTVEFESHKGDPSVIVRNHIAPDRLSPLFAAAAEQGILAALQSGEVGYPVINVKATLLDAEVHPEMSNETAFQAAGADAVRKAMHDNILLLEPIMNL